MTEYAETRHEKPTDTDLFEQSPSTGHREVAAVMGATPGFGDPDCAARDCDREDVTLDLDSNTMFCPYHMKHAETRRVSS